MTDKHDKLVEMAEASGATAYDLHDGEEWSLTRDQLAAFASAHVASLCADVEPVAWSQSFSDYADRLFFVKDVDPRGQKWIDGVTYTLLYPAHTVASLTAQRDAAMARVAELEKDAARYRWLRSVPNAFKAQRIVNDTPHGMDATIDAAMNGGNQ